RPGFQTPLVPLEQASRRRKKRLAKGPLSRRPGPSKPPPDPPGPFPGALDDPGRRRFVPRRERERTGNMVLERRGWFEPSGHDPFQRSPDDRKFPIGRLGLHDHFFGFGKTFGPLNLYLGGIRSQRGREIHPLPFPAHHYRLG